MPTLLGKRLKRAAKQFSTEMKLQARVSPQELEVVIANEEGNRVAASWLEEQVKSSPQQVWFPSDGEAPTWVPSWFTFGRDR